MFVLPGPLIVALVVLSQLAGPAPATFPDNGDLDELNRPSQVQHQRNGNTILTLGYTYDAAGNLASYTDNLGTATFAYDDLERLISADYPSGQSYGYTYDSVGNITQAVTPSQTLSYTYDLADRITSSGPGGGAAPTYDNNGNMTSDGSYGNRTFTYDALGRLTGVTGNGVTEAYTLDAAGNRWADTVNSTTTSYDLDLTAEHVTVLSDGTSKFVPGLPSAGYEQAGTWYSSLTDIRGSQLGTVSNAGVISALRAYDPFGVARPGSTDATGIGFTGEWRDASGLYNLRARAYDPVTGRFVSRDTFGGVALAPQSLNRYTFGQANQMLAVDPSGHFVNNFLLSPEAWSMGFQMIPGLGDLYSAISGIVGFDLIAGRSLSDFEKVAYFTAGLIPVVTPGMAHLGGATLRNGLDELPTAQRFGVDLAQLSHAARYGDEFAALRPLRVGPGGGYRAAPNTAGGGVPSVVFSRSRAPGIAQNFDDAVANWAPTRLTRVDAATRDANRRAALRGQAPAPAGQSLDEYPFACSAQGGCGSFVRSVPVGEQSYQGGVLSRFFQDFGIRPGDPFDVMFGP